MEWVSATTVLVKGSIKPKPMPNVPLITIKKKALFEKIERIPLIVIIEEEYIQAFFLPNLSENLPEIIEPISIPTNIADMIISL
jgi:hypothetical protein